MQGAGTWYYRCCGGEQWRCPPPSVQLKIDFNLKFAPPFSEKYQKYEQHQDDHKAVPLSTPGRLCRPRSLKRGFCICGVRGLHANLPSAKLRAEPSSYLFQRGKYIPLENRLVIPLCQNWL